MRGREQELTEPAVLFEGLGLGPGEAAVVGSIVDDSPAEQAGLRAGDRVIRGNGEPIEDWNRSGSSSCGARPGETVELTVLRDGRELTLTATLETITESGTDVRPHRRQCERRTEQRYGILESLPRAVDEDLGDDHVHRVDARRT